MIINFISLTPYYGIRLKKFMIIFLKPMLCQWLPLGTQFLYDSFRGPLFKQTLVNI